VSEEQIEGSLAKVQADKSLQDQLNAAGADVEAIAKAAGFSITTEDLKFSNREPLRSLSDEELEVFAGGGLLGGSGGGCCSGPWTECGV